MKHVYDPKDFLINIICNNTFDIIAFSETWLISSKYDLSDFVLDMYNLHTSSRNSRTDAGVAVNVNDDFNQKAVCNISKIIENCMETIFYRNCS